MTQTGLGFFSSAHYVNSQTYSTHASHRQLFEDQPQKASVRKYSVPAGYFYHIVLFPVVWAYFSGEQAVRW